MAIQALGVITIGGGTSRGRNGIVLPESDQGGRFGKVPTLLLTGVGISRVVAGIEGRGSGVAVVARGAMGVVEAADAAAGGRIVVAGSTGAGLAADRDHSGRGAGDGGSA